MPTTQGGQSPAIVTGSNPRRPSRWEAPYQWDGSRAQGQGILSWMNECIQEGEIFLKNQTGYRFVDASHRIMADIGFDELPRTLSKASKNFVKRDVRELVGTLANPRPLSSFRTDNKEWEDQAEIINKGYLHWYLSSFADRRLREALQFAAVEGTGYLIQEWDPGVWSPTDGEITQQALGVDAVLPIQISPEDWDLQKAYAVIIRRQYPIFHVLRRFPLAAHLISPDGEAVSKFRRLVNNLIDKVTPTVQNTYGSQRGYRGEDPAGRQLVTIYDIYILDGQANMGNEPIKKGVEASPWEYNVPFYGQQIPIGMNMPGTVEPITRSANYHDSRLFPYRRHIIATRNAILYDDTSKWWHGQVPLVKFRLDDWPFEYCGIPVTKEPAKLQALYMSLLRAYDDSSNARLRPGLAYDKSRISEAMAKAMDPRVGGQVMGVNNMMGEAFKVITDPRYYTMEGNVLEFMQQAEEGGSRLMGLHDLVAMSKAAQIPGSDTIEKLAEMAGPMATDMSRNMESSMREIGEMWKCNFFEFYSVRKRFQILGRDGVTREDFDFDPSTLVPSNLDLPVVGSAGTRSERARIHMRNFHFSIVPNSIYSMTQSTRQLILLQLQRVGTPLAPKFIMEQFDIPNPEKRIEEFWEYKTEEAQKMTQIQIMATAMNPMAQLMGAMQQGMGGGGNPQGEGRPPTAQTPPHIEQKDSGTRSVISES
jgi:hypothetical protein